MTPVCDPSTKLLVVDDCEANLVFMRYMLTALNLEFDIARSGFEAIELMASKPYAVVLLDYQMPGMNGLEVLSWMKENLNLQPLTIVTTADPSRQTLERFFDAGCDYFVERPVTAKKLCQLIPDLIFANGDGLALAG